MYFAYGWPRTFSVDGGAARPSHAVDGGADALGARAADASGAASADAGRQIVQILADDDLIIVITGNGVQVWSSGVHRIRLGSTSRSAGAVQTEGTNKRAFWSSSRRLLAVVTQNSVLHYYGVRASKAEAVPAAAAEPGAAGGAPLKRLDVFLERSVVVEGGASCADIVGDSRALLLGMSDGSLRTYSWNAQFKGSVEPFSLTDDHQRLRYGLKSRSGDLRSTSSGSLATIPATPAWPQPQTPAWLQQHGSSGGLFPATSVELPITPAGGTAEASIVALDYASVLRLLAVVLADGRCAVCRTGNGGLSSSEPIQLSHFVCRAGSGAVSARIGVTVQLIAVGLASGDVALHKLYGWGRAGRRSNDAAYAEPLRVLSMHDWGYTPEVLGSVAALQWAPDNRALAVGWEWRGIAVWSPSGCRLMCSLRQAARAAAMTPRTAASLLSPFTAGPGEQPLPLEAGIASLAWGAAGFTLLLAEAPSAAPPQLLELSFAHSLTGAHRVQHFAGGAVAPQHGAIREAHLLLAADRVLMITEQPEGGGGGSAFGEGGPGATDLTVQHLRPPAAYLAANWPLRHVALSADGGDLAVAGRRGLALYARRSGRWRLFGDVSQERSLAVQGLLWLPRIVVACAQLAAPSGGKPALQPGAQLRLYPRSHVDEASCLARYPLHSVPMAMDSLDYHIVVILPPLDIRLLRVELQPGPGPGKSASASLVVTRELSIMSVSSPLTDIAIVQPRSVSVPSGASGGKGGQSVEPRHCVLLRASGVMTVLDLDQGSEITIVDDVESFWLSETGSASHSETQEDAASDTDGASVMGVSGSEALSRSSSSMSLADSMVAGVSGAVRRSPSDMQLSMDLKAGFAEAADPPAAASQGYGDVEMPWWTYGWRGMQLWFPSSLAEPLSPSTRDSMGFGASTDPELEFDREVYPVGISLSEVAILGVTQRTVRMPGAGSAVSGGAAGHGAYPCFHAMPESQPVLPCLLRRLLQKGKADAAAALAARHSGAPHFSRSLEWLLFTALEANADGQPAASHAAAQPQTSRQRQTRRGSAGSSEWANPSTPPRAGGPPSLRVPQQPPRPRAAPQEDAPPPAGPLLVAAAQLIRNFSQYADVVVSVARKMDAALWPALFDAVGPPDRLAEGLLAAGQPVSAACCLLIVDRLQGAATAQALALRTIQAAMDGQQFELVTELLRFVVPPGAGDAFLDAVRRPAADAAAAEGAAEQSAAVTLQPSSPPAQPPKSAGWLATLFGAGQQPASRPRPSTGAPAKDGSAGEPPPSLDTALAAWQLIAASARRLLDAGCLRAAACLGAALSALGTGLADLLATPLPNEMLRPPVSVPYAMRMAVAEFPALGDADAREEAAQLMAACSAGSVEPWTAVLALLLGDSATLAVCRQRSASVWKELVGCVLSETESPEHWQTLAAAGLGTHAPQLGTPAPAQKP